MLLHLVIFIFKNIHIYMDADTKCSFLFSCSIINWHLLRGIEGTMRTWYHFKCKFPWIANYKVILELFICDHQNMDKRQKFTSVCAKVINVFSAMCRNLCRLIYTMSYFKYFASKNAKTRKHKKSSGLTCLIIVSILCYMLWHIALEYVISLRMLNRITKKKENLKIKQSENTKRRRKRKFHRIRNKSSFRIFFMPKFKFHSPRKSEITKIR